MNDMSIKELEDELRTGEREVLDPRPWPRSGARAAGDVRARRALTAVGTAVRGGGRRTRRSRWAGPGGDERTNDDSVPVAEPPPHELSPLAQRALAEIPGAVQVSDWQVVLPSPDAESELLDAGDSPDLEVVGDTVPPDADSYHGVTMFPAHAWPAWLYDGILDYEQSQKDENGSYPVGSTGTGILVESAEPSSACVVTGRSARAARP